MTHVEAAGAPMHQLLQRTRDLFRVVFEGRTDRASHERDPMISMGMHEDLDVAMKTELREMIAFICGRTNFSREDAYQLCLLAIDFHVTQTVNGEKGIHGMLRKDLLPHLTQLTDSCRFFLHLHPTQVGERQLQHCKYTNFPRGMVIA